MTRISNYYINLDNKQRIASAITGLALVGAAICDFKNHSSRGWFELGLGVMLVTRGVSGFCPAKKMFKPKLMGNLA